MLKVITTKEQIDWRSYFLCVSIEIIIGWLRTRILPLCTLKILAKKIESLACSSLDILEACKVPLFETRPGPGLKNKILCRPRPGPVQKKRIWCRPGPARGLKYENRARPGPGPGFLYIKIVRFGHAFYKKKKSN
jgi:hypothetical protein